MKVVIKLSDIKENHRYTTLLQDFYDKLVIYKLEFSNKKIYIGQTKNLKRRLYSYISQYNTEKHLVKKAILKYGLDNVKLEILKVCSNHDDLNKSEVYFISLYDSCNLLTGYNLAFGGGSNTPSPQTIVKKIESSKKTEVGQYNLNGNLIKIFNSVREAGRVLDIPDTDIHRACKKKSSRLGYLFSKTLMPNIEPFHYKKQTGQWNLKNFKITNVATGDVVVIEGLNNVSKHINCSRKYLDNIIRRKSIFNKKFKVERL